ncbi:MAG: hypothetical protein AAB480_03590 [Patescibacteria group bacterium]|mgnify:FL=1
MGTFKTWSECTPEEQRKRREWWLLYFNDYDFWRVQEQAWQDAGIVPRHPIMMREEWEQKGTMGKVLT